MKYVEFTVFISRVSHEAYKGTSKADLPLHIKIDKCLGPLLEFRDLTAMFRVPDAEDADESGSGTGDDDELDESAEDEQDEK